MLRGHRRRLVKLLPSTVDHRGAAADRQCAVVDRRGAAVDR
jgi:hypothetical protein